MWPHEDGCEDKLTGVVGNGGEAEGVPAPFSESRK